MLKKYSNTHNLSPNNKKFLFFLNNYWLKSPLVVSLIRIIEFNIVNIEIGLNNFVRRSYGIDELALVPEPLVEA